MSKLIGSAATLEGLAELICKCWYWEAVTFAPITGLDKGQSWTVCNAQGLVPFLYVRFKRGRYRLEADPEVVK